MALAFRQWDPELEVGFVIRSWLKSFRKSDYAGPIPMHLYYDTYRAVVEDILARPGVEVWVAFNTEEDDRSNDIYGYCVIERGCRSPVLHFAYTKQIYRQKGVMRACLKAAGFSLDGLTYTFKTPAAAAMARKHRWQWDPSLPRHPKAPGSGPQRSAPSRESSGSGATSAKNSPAES